MGNTELTEQLFHAMVQTDRTLAQEIVEQMIAENIASEDIIYSVLNPALTEIGKLWSKSSISLAQTFVAAKIAEDVLFKCLPEGTSASGSAPKGVAVIGNVEDDFHSLGRKIIIAFLHAAGWEIHDLGNDVAAEDFVDEAVRCNASVIAVSAMMHTTALNIKKIRTIINDRGLSNEIKLAVGGAVFNWYPELVKEVGGDGTAQNASETDALFCELQASIKRNVAL